MKILLVDDEPVHLRLMQATLRHWGFEVVTASSGEAAWEILERDAAPALVIADWNMPGMDGFELIRKIRSLPALASTPVLMITVQAATVTSQTGGVQADDYLIKPWSPKDLRAVVDRLLTGSTT